MERRPSSCKVKKKMDFISSTKDGTWIFLPSDSPLIARERCLEIANERSVCSVRVHHALARSHWISWAHARLPRNESFLQFFPPKTHRNTHDEGKRWEIYLAFKDLVFSCRISAVFFDKGEICELRPHRVTGLASPYVEKQHRTNNEPQSHGKLAINWAGEKLGHGYTEKATTNPSLCKWTDLLYICAHNSTF